MNLLEKFLTTLITVLFIVSCKGKMIDNTQSGLLTVTTPIEQEDTTVNTDQTTGGDINSDLLLDARRFINEAIGSQTVVCRGDFTSSLSSRTIVSKYSTSTISLDGESEISKTFTLKTSFYIKNNRNIAILSLLEEGRFRQLLLDTNRNVILRGDWTNPSRHTTLFTGEFEFDENIPDSIIISLLGSRFLKFKFKVSEGVNESTVTYFANSFALPPELRNAQTQPILILDSETVFDGDLINELLCKDDTVDTDFNESSFDSFFDLFTSNNQLICNLEEGTASGFTFIESSYPVGISENSTYKMVSNRDFYIFNLNNNSVNSVTRIREVRSCERAVTQERSGDSIGTNCSKDVTLTEGNFTQTDIFNNVQITIDNEKINFFFRKMPKNEIAVMIRNSSKFDNLGWVYKNADLKFKLKSIVNILCSDKLSQ